MTKKKEVVKDEITKKLGYAIVINAMVLIDVTFLCALCAIKIPDLVFQLIKVKLGLGCALLFGLKAIKPFIKN